MVSVPELGERGRFPSRDSALEEPVVFVFGGGVCVSGGGAYGGGIITESPAPGVGRSAGLCLVLETWAWGGSGGCSGVWPPSLVLGGSVTFVLGRGSCVGGGGGYGCNIILKLFHWGLRAFGGAEADRSEVCSWSLDRLSLGLAVANGSSSLTASGGGGGAAAAAVAELSASAASTRVTATRACLVQTREASSQWTVVDALS